jgi:hypothetical protein
MTLPTRRSNQTFGALSAAAETVAEHRARLAQQQEVAQQRRTEALTSQASMTNSPSQRIRIWEELHRLPLPLGPNHKLLGVIADATQLHIEQVQEVQKLRVALRAQGSDTRVEGGCEIAPR